MRTNEIVWTVIGTFFFLSATLYTVWNALEYANVWHPTIEALGLKQYYLPVEWIGTIAMYFVALMSWMIAFYLGRVRKASQGTLPEDMLTADVDDGDPEVGEFSPWSWWPIVLAGAAGFAMLGFAVGTWLVPIGVGVFVVAIVGWVYEYYRGHFAR